MEAENKPYAVCHMLMALDGKINGACMSAACANTYVKMGEVVGRAFQDGGKLK